MSADNLGNHLIQFARRGGVTMTPARTEQIKAYVEEWGQERDEIIDKAFDKLKITVEKAFPAYHEVRGAIYEARSSTPDPMQNFSSDCDLCDRSGGFSAEDDGGHSYAWRCTCPAGEKFQAVPLAGPDEIRYRRAFNKAIDDLPKVEMKDVFPLIKAGIRKGRRERSSPARIGEIFHEVGGDEI